MAGAESGYDDVLASSQENARPSSFLQAPPASLAGENAALNTQKRRKIKSAELEEMHAASQRLLRETPNASFKPQVTTGKSITSILEKIRLRKKQLVQGNRRRSAFLVVQPDALDSLEVVIEEFSSFRSLAPQAQDLTELKSMVGIRENEVEKKFNSNASKHASEQAKATDGHAEEDVDHVDMSKLPENQDDITKKSAYLGCGNAFRSPMEYTQDLLSCSEESSDNDDDDTKNLNLNREEDEVYGGSRVNLHLDTETQDDYEEWLDKDANKENMAPASSKHKQVSKGPSVRALIDDEAEDEDEDVLVPGDDDEGDDGDDLDDMVVEETNEKVKDKEKRAELHRKWLEQQDAVMTDDILLRLKTGWRPRDSRKRGMEFLDDDVELSAQKEGDIEASPHEDPELQGNQELLDEDSQDVEALKDDIDPDVERSFKYLDDVNDVHESSDDEEAEQRLMRQRFLQESEEQGEFMSPVEDETSRVIFGLINKVNIASSNKKHVNSMRYLSGGTSNSNSSASKSSFLRRSGSSTLGSVQRQNSSSGSGARSFIFGRDDSNSSHSFDQHRENKENVEPTANALFKQSPQFRHHGQGKDNSKAPKLSGTRLGPSLFEILSRQSMDLDHSLKKKALFEEGGHPMSPILTAFKPIKSINTPRGTHRA